MAKLTIPLSVVQAGEAFADWYYNNCILRASQVALTTDETNAYAVNSFKLGWNAINTLLANGGEMEEYLMAIHAGIDLLADTVPDGCPNRMTYNTSGAQVPKTFNNWLVPGSDFWKKDDNTEILFLTNPFAGNEDKYLKASEIKLIADLPNTIEILKQADAMALLLTGWTKIV